MKHFYCILLFVLFTLTVYGQNNFSVTGTLTDKNTEELVYLASVRLLNTNDSSFVKGTSSNDKGVFTFANIKKGDYIIEISYLGYKNLYRNVSLSGDSPVINTGKIQLETDAILLQEAVVVGKAVEVMVKNDTIEYNANAFKTPENAVIQDLLKKLPGVEVDNAGKITVNGKEVKKFLVEGKEFFSDDPQVASKNLPAELVEKLQVLDRRSDMARLTGFDDGEEETVINITVKQGMKKGTMGNAMAGAGKDVNEDNLRYEAGGMVNHMFDKERYTLMLNANNTNNMGASDMGAQRFGGMRGMRRGSGGIAESQNLAFNMDKEFSPEFSFNASTNYSGSDQESKRKVKTNTTIDEFNSLLEQNETRNNDISDNFGINFRLEWKPDTSNTIIFRPNFSYNKSESSQEELFSSFNSNTDTLYNGNARSLNQGEGYNTGARLEYAHKFFKPGRVLSFVLDGGYNDSYSFGNSNWVKHIYENNIYNRDSLVNQRSENDNNSISYRAEMSYVEPVGKNNFIQFAYRINRYNSQSINSTYNVYEDLYNPVSSADTLILYGDESRSTKRFATEQRFSLNFKAVRKKYNYTIGFNIDPSISNNKTVQPYQTELNELILPPVYDYRLPNVIGDSLVSEIKQDVVNFSPILNFNYLFGQRTNLRIDYSGNTIQPTAIQLQDFEDRSNPMNIVRGNPSLKPSYRNNFSARYQKFVPETQLFYNVDFRGDLSFNDIASVVTIDPKTGVRNTTYENINGNWDLNLRGGFNIPLNKKFSIGNFNRIGYEHMKSYSNELLNTTKEFSFNENFRFNFHSDLDQKGRWDLFDVSLNASFSYMNVVNELQKNKNQQTYDWRVGSNIGWYLPHNLTIETDINWTDRSGYNEGFNTSELLWNSSVTKQIFNGKQGTGSFRLKIYDILQDRKSISRSVGSNYVRDTESNTIPSFFTCSFIYRFSVFPKGSSATQDDMHPRWGGQGSGRPGPGGGPGRDMF